MSLLSAARRLYLSCFELHDKAWKPTGLRFTTARDYDESAAVNSARKARRRSATGKLLPKPKPAHQAEIVPLRRAK